MCHTVTEGEEGVTKNFLEEISVLRQPAISIKMRTWVHKLDGSAGNSSKHFRALFLQISRLFNGWNKKWFNKFMGVFHISIFYMVGNDSFCAILKFIYQVKIKVYTMGPRLPGPLDILETSIIIILAIRGLIKNSMSLITVIVLLILPHNTRTLKCH